MIWHKSYIIFYYFFYFERYEADTNDRMNRNSADRNSRMDPVGILGGPHISNADQSAANISGKRIKLQIVNSKNNTGNNSPNRGFLPGYFWHIPLLICLTRRRNNAIRVMIPILLISDSIEKILSRVVHISFLQGVSCLPSKMCRIFWPIVLVLTEAFILDRTHTPILRSG